MLRRHHVDSVLASILATRSQGLTNSNFADAAMNSMNLRYAANIRAFPEKPLSQCVSKDTLAPDRARICAVSCQSRAIAFGEYPRNCRLPSRGNVTGISQISPMRQGRPDAHPLLGTGNGPPDVGMLES